MTQKSEAQKGNITPEMEFVAQKENIDVNKLARLIDKGLVVMISNWKLTRQNWRRNMELTHLWTCQQVPI